MSVVDSSIRSIFVGDFGKFEIGKNILVPRLGSFIKGNFRIISGFWM